MLFLQCPRCAKPLPGHANYCRRCGCPVRPASPTVTSAPAPKSRRREKPNRGWLVLMLLIAAFMAIRWSASNHRKSSPPSIRITPSRQVDISSPAVEESRADRRTSRERSRRYDARESDQRREDRVEREFDHGH